MDAETIVILRVIILQICQTYGDGVPRNRSLELMTPAADFARWGAVRDPPQCGFFCAAWHKRKGER